MYYRQLLLLVIELWVAYVSLSATLENRNQGFISIDCGEDQDYVDKETGILYKSDRDFVTTGENQDISPEYDDDNVPAFRRQLKNVRFFPKGRKNCYRLRPEQGKNHYYLIRAFFKYGNYDSRNEIPTFSIYLGVNLWGHMQVSEVSEFRLREIIHFSLTDTIHVCLVNTGFGTPFISGLELRLLNFSSHQNETRTFDTFDRYDLGNSTNMLVRYKDDVYDRVWSTSTPPDYISVNTTTDVKIQSSSSSCYFSQLPAEVWRSAIQPVSPGRSISNKFSCPENECYICFYFAEILQTSPAKRRVFTISLNNVSYGPITLEYLKPLTICRTVSSIQGYVQVFLNSTMRSDLPPLLNAFELLAVMPFPDSPTYVADVEGMMAMMQSYNINRDEWQGDPCVPSDLSWDGLNCSYDTTPPRIISLDLSSSRLTGKFSSSFSTLQALKSLNLSYNELSGTVPEFLAQLPNLTILNLTGNKLTGLVPQSLTEKSNSGILQLSLDGNPNLCEREDACKKRKRNFLVPITISVISVLVLLLFSCTTMFWRTNRRAQSKNERSGILKHHAFSFSEIISITDDFGTIIGEGGFGKVYLGTLMDNTQVAVKLLSQCSRQGFKEFRAEAELLMIVHHRNLVTLVGYSDDRGNKALIYEYMANGNLRDRLSETSGRILNWVERLRIAVDAAYGLEYLHNGCKPPIIHRDLKTSNILLNEKLQAKIADFGLSRAFTNESVTHITTTPAGTYGYMDPEVRRFGNFSKKSDVYSFGIILLELISGERPILSDASGNCMGIEKWAISIIERGDIRSVVDPKLQGEFDPNSAWKAVETALACALNPAIERPDISHVLAELKECLATAVTVARSERIEEGRTRSMNSLRIGSLQFDTDMEPSPR